MSTQAETGRRDFWKSAGYHLTNRLEDGRLAVSADLLRAYFTRPEVHPVEESCEAEHRLFEALMDDPFRAVADAEIEAIRDPDAADNYRFVLRFRDHLAAAGSIEAAYAGLMTSGAIQVPPVFIDQLVHMILRSILDRETDPMRLRAAELLFRDQSVSTEEGQILLADAEIVEMMSETGGLGGLGALLMESGTPMQTVTMDVMTEENAHLYWDRSDRFDMAIDFRFAEPAQDAFARVLESWIGHMASVPVRIQPMQSIRDERWSWHIGLDATATQILNALYKGEELHPDRTAQIMALFRMEPLDKALFRQSMRGKPVYLGLAMDERHKLKVKPQNLLTNLPLEAAE
jgi:hypothetical protein